MPEPLDAEARDERTPQQSIPSASSRPPDRRHWLHSLHSLHWLNVLVSMLVVAGIIGVALALLRPHVSPVSPAAGPPTLVSPTPGVDTWVGGIPVTREAQADGLHVVLQLTPGPYFLGELLAANLSLTNDSRTTYTLAGPSVAGGCGAAVFVAMSGGGGGPQYVLPVADVHSCPFITSKLTPGKTLTLHEFMPVSNTGEVTLESGANFLQTVAGPDGSQSTTSGHSPLDGRWPSIRIAVAATTPSDRQITVQRKETQVQITAPAAARAHLYYLYTVACNAFQGGTVGTGNFAWEPIAATIVHEPDCGDYGSHVIQWSYAVSAPGYAIASGHVGS